jgi:hypothetical protein
MKKFWFKPKKYGIGFFPVSTEGWTATFILMGLILVSAYTNSFFDSGEDHAIYTKDGLRFLLDLIVLCSVFTLLFKNRVEGGLQWRWGYKQKSDGKNDE